MVPVEILIIHVGNMTNKGTQALLKSDFYILSEIRKDAEISISTTDIDGVKGMNLPLNAILPPLIDIPFVKADMWTKKSGYNRGSFRYKVYVMACLIQMFIQIVLSLISATLCIKGIKPFYRTEAMSHLKKCSMVASCSDENFKEYSSWLPFKPSWIVTWWSILFARTWEVLIAKKLFGKPVVVLPNSIGPFKTHIGRFLARLALVNCDRVLTRESVSYNIAKSLKTRTPIVLTSDTALLFRSVFQESYLSGFSNPTVCVSPGVYSHSLSKKELNYYIEEHAAALDEISNRYGVNIILLPHYITGFKDDDFAICECILSRMKRKDRAKIIRVDTVDEFSSVLSHMDVLISSKMHPAVLAVAAFVPSLYISYDHKQTGFFEQLDMLNYTIDIREISRHKILSKMDSIWSNRQKIRNSLINNVPILQQNVKKAIKEAISPFLN
jgi:polysaccharide pyruvyl transferase WcaK-like protein